MKEGLYKAFFSSCNGSSSAFFVIKEGTIRGLDLGGFQYTGSYKNCNGRIVDASIQMVKETAPYNLSEGILQSIVLPDDFLDGKIHGLNSPIGLISASFEYCHEY